MAHPIPGGFHLVIEGIDGAGKSTIASRLVDLCRGRDIACIASREPTRGQWGLALRESAKTGRLTLADEFALFLKDRAEHVATLIRPALDAGSVVIIDRYYLSTAAYQGARGMDPAFILAENEKFAPAPDLVLLLDFDPAAGHDRIRQRGGAPDAFEDLAQLREVRRIFLSIARPFIRVIDAARPPEDVWAACLAEFDRALREKQAHP